MLLKDSPAELGLSSISTIKSNLDRIFGKDVWVELENETISIELGFILDELLLDKIGFLKALALKPELFYKDVLFFLYGSEVINNNVADFQTVPHLTSLELAFALTEVEYILGEFKSELSTGVKAYINHIMIEEGYSEAPWPFSKYGTYYLTPGQTKKDIEDKQMAIKAYILSHKAKLNA